MRHDDNIRHQRRDGSVKAAHISGGPPVGYSPQRMDWSKTILSLGGADAHKDFPLDGINLMPILTGEKKNIERTFYWRTFQRTKQKAVRDGNWKYLQDENGEYLFNLVADPGEKNDVKAKEETIFNRLKQKYVDWEKTVLQPIPL